MNVDDGCGNHVYGSQLAEPYKFDALVVGGLAFFCLESGMGCILCHYVYVCRCLVVGLEIRVVEFCDGVFVYVSSHYAAIVTDGLSPSDIS